MGRIMRRPLLHCRLEGLDELKVAGMNTLQLDVTSSESVNAAVEQIMTNQGRIDILVCNAGPPFSSLKL